MRTLLIALTLTAATLTAVPSDVATWVAVPVSSLMTREPMACQEGNG